MIGDSEPAVSLDESPEDAVPTYDGNGDGTGDGAVDVDGDHIAEPARKHRVRRRRRSFPRSLTIWFLLIGVPIGTFLVFAIPAMQGLDEPNHFLRVYTITDGTITVPSNRSGRPTVEVGGLRAAMSTGIIRRGLHAQGVVVDRCVAAYIGDNLTAAATRGPMDIGVGYRSPAHCAHEPNVFERIDNTAINSPASYLPQVVAVGVLRLFGAPIPLIFYGARLFGLAVYLALLALAIAVTPRGKALLFVIGLLPMSLQTAATINADSMTLAAALLLVALTIRCTVDEDAGWRWFGALALCACFLALCKNPYGMLALLILLVPAARLAARPLRGRRFSVRTVTAAKISVVALAGLLAVGWFAVGNHGNSLAADYPPHYVNQHVQSYVLTHHPMTVVTDILHTLEDKTYQGTTYLSAFLELGFFRNQDGGSYPPLLIALLGSLALFVAYTAELAGGRFRGRFAHGPAVLRTAWLWLPSLLVVGFTLVLLVENFVRGTPPGSYVIEPLDGIPGRYFLPVLAVPMVSVALAKGTGTRRVPNGWLAVAMLVMCAYLVVKVFTRFY